MEGALYFILGLLACATVSASDVEELSRRLDRQEERVIRLTQEVNSLNKELLHQNRKHRSMMNRLSYLEQDQASKNTATPKPTPDSEVPETKLLQGLIREMLRGDLGALRSSLAEEKKRGSQVSAAVKNLKEASGTHSDDLKVVRVNLTNRIAALSTRTDELETKCNRCLLEETGQQLNNRTNELETKCNRCLLEETGQQLNNRTNELETKCNRCLLEETGHQLNNSIGQIKKALAEMVGKVANVTELKSKKESENCTKDKAPSAVGLTHVVLTTSTAPDEGGMKACPDNWVAYGGSCYFFQQTKVRVDQDSAGESCNTLYAGSVLVAIETADEFDFLKTHLIRLYPSIRSSTFNGWMTSGKKDGNVYKWTTTGKAVNGSALWWKPGEPDEQGCISFWPRSFNMATVQCGSYPRQYICEM